MSNNLRRCGLLCLVLIASPAFATLSIIQHVHAFSQSDSTTVTCTLTATGASRNLVVGVAWLSSNLPSLAVASVSDNIGNVYTLAPGSASSVSGRRGTQVWYKLAAASGVTSVTVTFSGVVINVPKLNPGDGYYRSCFVYEVSGAATFDTADAVVGTNNLALLFCDPVNCTGASVVTSTTTGFTLGVAIASYQLVDQNPKTGNEFTSGGDLDDVGTSAAASLISSTAAVHQPVWHLATSAGWPQATFSSSTASFKQ